MSCSAQSSIKIMEVCQKTSDSCKVGVGVKEQSNKDTHPNQQKVQAPTCTANTSKQPNCVTSKPCTVRQSAVSEPAGTKTMGNQHHEEKTFPVLKNVR